MMVSGSVGFGQKSIRRAVAAQRDFPQYIPEMEFPTGGDFTGGGSERDVGSYLFYRGGGTVVRKMSLPSLEIRIIATFKQGLKRAVSEYNGLSWSDVDSITEQKLLLMGIRAYELEDEVTIQWYADGDMLPELDKGIDDTGHLAITDGDDGPYPTVGEISSYYNPEKDEQSEHTDQAETMPEIVRADTFDWLREYYKRRRVPFQELYLTNLDIHLHNYQCVQACDLERETAFPDDLVQPLVTATEKLKQELLRYQIFSGLETYVTEFFRVANAVMEWCEENTIPELDQQARTEYKRLFSHLNTFYYQGLWKQITRLVAVYTIDGPQAYFERAADWGRIDRTRKRFIEVFEKFQKTATEYGIDVNIREERLTEVWVKKEGVSKEEFVDWNVRNSLSKAEVVPISDDDPVTDLAS